MSMRNKFVLLPVILLATVGCSYNNGMNSSFSNSIWKSISEGDVSAIEEFGEGGGNLRLQKPISKESLLQYAFKCKQKESFKKLLEINAAVDVFDKNGLAIVHNASGAPDSWWLSQLVKGDIDVNLKSKGGGSALGTPLHFAIINERLDCLEILLKSGADPDLPSDSIGQTPLREASFNANGDQVVCLLDHKASPTAKHDTADFLDSLSRRSYSDIEGEPKPDRMIQKLAEMGYGEEYFKDSGWGNRPYSDRLKVE
ncbi:ankyrin repeat domain-containing protein [Stieleria varia]|uniref:Ankyrin repeats (3 copies) n=1 Tax=Stieleria varia TaxID=2528005 RepID=A0A5C6BAR6_9BACT|nr:ankyrin repeat domain-containing protein [Stieleria varia]TWU08356.1 Ankyrin repeats (3 copies) [Stieleria varia]